MTTNLARILGGVPNPADLGLRAGVDDTEAYAEAYNWAMVLLILTLGNAGSASSTCSTHCRNAATLEEQIAIFETMVLELPDGDPFEEFMKTYFLYGGSRQGADGEEVYFSGILQGQAERTVGLFGHDFGVDRTAVTGRIQGTGVTTSEPTSFFTTFAESTVPWTAPRVTEAGGDVEAGLPIWSARRRSRPAQRRHRGRTRRCCSSS